MPAVPPPRRLPGSSPHQDPVAARRWPTSRRGRWCRTSGRQAGRDRRAWRSAAGHAPGTHRLSRPASHASWQPAPERKPPGHQTLWHSATAPPISRPGRAFARSPRQTAQCHPRRAAAARNASHPALSRRVLHPPQQCWRSPQHSASRIDWRLCQHRAGAGIWRGFRAFVALTRLSRANPLCSARARPAVRNLGRPDAQALAPSCTFALAARGVLCAALSRCGECLGGRRRALPAVRRVAARVMRRVPRGRRTPLSIWLDQTAGKSACVVPLDALHATFNRW
jgi:hypothetical protein